ncbi:MAG: VWA domain-containing protein [Terriglobales bacterium]
MINTTCLAIILNLILTAASHSQELQHPVQPGVAPAKSAAAERKTDTSPLRETEVTVGHSSTPELAPEDPAFTISTRVDEVNLFLSVTDAKGRFVDNLSANDLKLLDDHKAPAKWDYFQARTNLPLNVILAIDVSSSVRDRLHFEQQAASSFLKRILRKETDQAAIVAFGSNVQEKTDGMTSDTRALEATIKNLQAGGETAMYDAIVLASRKLRAARGKTIVRPVIILITDGVDTASKATLRAAEEAATRSEAAIFALDANSIYEKNPKGRKVLDRLTRETGGFVLSARENSDLKGSFSKIEKILRCQYALGYPPPDLEANGRFRSIEVTSNRRGLQVHARNGYYAPAQ